jgi:gamma-glutamylcyclotransferase (GGCT)/AIG2-like uncharacterized protein YtfP
LKEGGYFAKSFNNDRLTSVPGYITEASLYHLGTYPAILPAPGKDRAVVHGEVHTYKDPEKTLRMFDHIEGYKETEPERSHYLRKKVEVVIGQDGETVEAWAYFYNQMEDEPSPKEKGWTFMNSGFWPVPQREVPYE